MTSPRIHSWWRTALTAGLLAGAMDICAAVTINTLRGSTPLRVLQSVASGLLGTAAYDGGVMTGLLGLLLHFAIMLVIAGIFVQVAKRQSWLVRYPWQIGPLFGIAVYAVMNAVVLPLSAFPHSIRYTGTTLAIGLTVHVLCIGLPIALVTAHQLRGSAEKSAMRGS